jgi:hypothetical protein
LRRNLLILLLLAPTLFLRAQYSPRFSVSTDIGVLKSFKAEQKFIAFGHTVQSHFHIAEKDGIYFWFSYYSGGKFHNSVVADAKPPGTVPVQINYRSDSKLSFKQFSLGWRHYLHGNAEMEKGWNLYGFAGFGLIYGSVNNSLTPRVDTNLYYLPVREGEGKFKRLSLDLGVGYEKPLGADFFWYAELRSWIPTSGYPSRFLFINKNAPLVGQFNSGIRVLF